MIINVSTLKNQTVFVMNTKKNPHPSLIAGQAFSRCVCYPLLLSRFHSFPPRARKGNACHMDGPDTRVYKNRRSMDECHPAVMTSPGPATRIMQPFSLVTPVHSCVQSRVDGRSKRDVKGKHISSRLNLIKTIERIFRQKKPAPKGRRFFSLLSRRGTYSEVFG